ncbi:hypothetical protein KA078_01935 [Candidatus Woesebacteria bacterium]|nr:hypothetical protein [Candidatus Woesebacteria bacterium]
MSNMDGRQPGPTQELQQKVDTNVGGLVLGVPPAEATKLLREVLPGKFPNQASAEKFVRELGAQATDQAVRDNKTEKVMAGLGQAYKAFVGQAPEGPATSAQAAGDADLERIMAQMDALGKKP